jgi:simple sugar transport system substrate-binding protein
MLTHGAATNAFWQAVKKGFDDACTRVQAHCQMVFTQTDGSIEQQSANFQAAEARKPDAILTTIVDDNALTPMINDARAKHIIVIAYNVDQSAAARRVRRNGRRLSARTLSRQGAVSPINSPASFQKTDRSAC